MRVQTILQLKVNNILNFNYEKLQIYQKLNHMKISKMVLSICIL